MYKGGAHGFITGKMLLIANTMPKFIDESGALANRFIAFPFTKSFVGKENLELPKLLSAEKAGIFNFALKGLKRLIKQGKFTQADAAIEMVEDMKRDMFPLADFCEDCCDIGNGLEITSKALYKVYQYYCGQCDLHHMSHINFTKHLKSSYLPITHGRMQDGLKQVRGFKGINVNKEWQDKINGLGFKPVVQAPIKEIRH